jgi:hypothetical protein
MKYMLKAPGTKHLKRSYDESPSNIAFNCNLRRYNKAPGQNGANAKMMSFGLDLSVKGAGVGPRPRPASRMRSSWDSGGSSGGSGGRGCSGGSGGVGSKTGEGGVSGAANDRVGIPAWERLAALRRKHHEVGRCRFTVSKPMLALESAYGFCA